MAPSTKRRLTLFEEINRLTVDDGDLLFQLMEEIDEVVVQAVGFRWASVATQSHQDRTLRNYEKFLELCKLIPDNASESQREELAFPRDHTVLYSQARK
jgi:hypothetical protein